MNIGKKIRSLRMQRGMTQRELAGDMITRNMLSSIENGAAMPSISSLLYIAERLDVSPAYFFDDSEKPQSEIESILCSLYNEGEYEKCISIGSSLPASSSGNIPALNITLSNEYFCNSPNNFSTSSRTEKSYDPNNLTRSSPY